MKLMFGGSAMLYKTNKLFNKWDYPFLPEEDITSTYFAIKELTLTELALRNLLKVSFIKFGLMGRKIFPCFTTNLAQIMLNLTTSLKSNIRTSHPNIWKFLSSLEDIILDLDLELRKL